jgi:hypothetical protein
MGPGLTGPGPITVLEQNSTVTASTITHAHDGNFTNRQQGNPCLMRLSIDLAPEWARGFVG